MTRATVILLVFNSLGIISVKSQAFLVAPTDTCLPCGGTAEFNCSTTYLINLGDGNSIEGAGGQMWKIQTPDGRIMTLSSNMPSMVPTNYEFISRNLHEYTGIRVDNTNSDWNGTIFQCIAFSPTNTHQQNASAPPVVLEVGGPPSNIFCECRRCPDVNGLSTSEQSTSIRPPTNTCSCAMPSPTAMPSLTVLQPSIQVHQLPFSTQDPLTLSVLTLPPSQIPNPTSSPSGGLSTGTITGIVVGGVVGVVLINLIIVIQLYIFFKKKNQSSASWTFSHFKHEDETAVKKILQSKMILEGLGNEATQNYLGNIYLLH